RGVAMSMTGESAATAVDSGPAVGERVLIVEDDSAARLGLEQLVKNWGFIAEAAADGEEALEKVTTFRPAIVITDLVMPRMDGLALLRALQQQGADVTTLLLTAQGTVETAVEAMKEGAYDYLTKPVDLKRLKILLDKIVERLETVREVKALRRQLREHGTFGPLIGSAPEMRKLYQIIEQAAPTSASMLILGESGTGKELVAQTIHQLSPRAAAPFVAINCAAIPDTLLESEIFGHEKGAFTGATDRRAGCFDLAGRGTLFLDELAETAHLPVFSPASFAGASAPAAANGISIAPGMTVDEAEQKLIMATLDSAGGNKTRAAEMLGISLKTLHNKLNRFKTETSES